MRHLCNRVQAFIVPPWLTVGDVLLLIGQCAVASLLLFALAGTIAGFLHPPVNVLEHPVATYIVAWSCLALVAAAGIYRNLQWAYLLELPILVSILFIKAQEGIASVSFPPGLEHFNGILYWLEWAVALGLVGRYLLRGHPQLARYWRRMFEPAPDAHV